MKWFKHFNDLSKSPVMQRITADLGKAGFANAIILLETLSRNEEKGKLKLPLKNATDLKFWQQEFDLTAKQTKHTLDVFEEAGLILPWQTKQVICAPMLEALADEYSQKVKKNKAKKKKTEEQNKEEKERENRIEGVPRVSGQYPDNSTAKEKPKNPPSPSLSLNSNTRPCGQEIEQLAEDVKNAAIQRTSQAAFSEKAVEKIKQVIAEANPTKAELVTATRGLVDAMDDFQLKNAGSGIASNLAAHIKVNRFELRRKEKQAQDLERIRAEIEARRPIEQKARDRAEAEKERMGQEALNALFGEPEPEPVAVAAAV
jgi:hypothetical protein